MDKKIENAIARSIIKDRIIFWTDVKYDDEVTKPARIEELNYILRMINESEEKGERAWQNVEAAESGSDGLKPQKEK